MLGWVLAGLLFSAAVITIAVAFLDAQTAREGVKNNCPNAVKAVVRNVMKDGSVTHVKMDALDDYDNTVGEITFEADSVSSDIYSGKKIYI